MSIQALSWAIETSMGLGLTANDKMVLWQLADAHNIDHGAFLAQATIAKRCEISRATVNRCLDRLEETRLIRRQARIHPVNKQQLPTRYFLGFEEGMSPQHLEGRVSNRDTEIPGPSGAEAGGDPVDNEPADEGAVSQTVSHSSETLTLEPITPLPPNASASFDALVANWGEIAAKDEARSAGTFARLGPEDQTKAVALASAFRQGCYSLGRKKPDLRSYLRGKLWLEFEDAPPIENHRFKVVKGSPEFAAWKRHFVKRSAVIATGMDRQGYLTVETRWPPDPTRSPQSTEEEDA